MIYLDNAATTFQKPPKVIEAVRNALYLCGSAGRSGHEAALRASQVLYDCRCVAAELFDAAPEEVVFTFNATHGLNIAIKSLVKPGDRVVISGFEHNAVLRPLYAIGAEIVVAGRKVFDVEDTVSSFRSKVNKQTKAVICTHMSNVFGYVLPVREIAEICHENNVPLILDAAQSAGVVPISMKNLKAAYIAMPGHKGLLGPQGTGLLLSNHASEPLIHGGTGSYSKSRNMPDFLPDRLEAGTMNTHGIAGLLEGIRFVKQIGVQTIFEHDKSMIEKLTQQISPQKVRLFSGENNQCSVISFCPRKINCEEMGNLLSKYGVAVRAGFHCAPLAHESVGTYQTGTVRASVSAFTKDEEIDEFSDLINNLNY